MTLDAPGPHLAVADRLVRRYVHYIRDHAPVESTRIGLVERDTDLPDLSSEAMQARSTDLARLAHQIDEAAHALTSGVEPADATQTAQHAAEGAHVTDAREAAGDLQLLAEEVAFRRFILFERARLSYDPLATIETVAAGMHELITGEGFDEDDKRRRVLAAGKRAASIPRFLEQAGTLLEHASAPHLTEAQRRIPDLIRLLADGLPRRAQSLGVSVAQLGTGIAASIEGLEAFAALLTELSDEPAFDWRLGAHGHDVVLRTALGSSTLVNDVYARARSWRDQVRAEMVELASNSWTRHFPGQPLPADETTRIRRTLSAIADRAVAPEAFVAEAQAAVDDARRYAQRADMVDLPPAERLTIQQIPAYLGGIAVAFIAPPPALRPEAGCTFYISPAPLGGAPLGGDDASRRAFLREYHPLQLRWLAIHETYPGHFVQLEHAARHPRLARRLLTRPVFAEGWSGYVEREVVERGLPALDSTAPDGVFGLEPDDLVFTQRKLELRIATNAMLDVGLHSGDLDDPAALELLSAGAFQTESEAAGKLARAKVTPGQLSTYFIGAEELRDLRHAEQTRQGSAFDARQFHQQVLSHGTPTVRIVADALAAGAPSRRPFAPTSARRSSSSLEY